MEENYTTTNISPDQNFIEKVNKSIEYNHPAEIAYRDGRKAAAAKKVDEIEYDRRELVDGDAVYVVEDREDGPYIIAQQSGTDPVRSYGDDGLRLDELPEDVIDKTVMDRVGDVAKGTAKAAEGTARGIGLGLTKFVTNVARSAIDNPIGDFVIGEENVQQFENFSKEFLKNAEEIARSSGIVGKTEFGKPGKEFGKAGQIGVGIGDVTGQFIAPAGGLYKGFRAMGAGPILSSLLADASVGFFGVAPETENLANIIPEDSEAFGALRDLMATDPDDSEFTNRVRNAAEAMALLGVGEGIGRGIVKTVEAAKKAIVKSDLPEGIGKAIDKFIKDETGSIGGDIPKKPVIEKDVEQAKNLIARTGEEIVPIDVSNRARAALKMKGNAEGIDFNLARMETPDELNNLIDTISEVYKEPIKKAKRGVETFSETQAKADLSLKMGFDVDKVLARQSGELWPAHKIKAARDIFVSELQKTDDLARLIKDGDNTSENLIAFRRQLAVVSGVQAQIKGVQTETARALSQYRMTAKTAMEKQVNLSEMIQKSGGADMNETLVDAYLNVIENGGADAAAAFARNAEQVTGWDMVYEAWINSLLGSPSTHAVNMIGNSLTIGQATVERYAAATYGAIERGVGKLAGKEIGGVTFKEANAFTQGYVMSVNDAFVAMGKAMKTGDSGDIFGKIDYHGEAITVQNINELPLAKTLTSKFMKGDDLVKSNSPLAHMIDFMGEYYYRAPGRFLMAEDELFKTLNYRAQLHALAARNAGDVVDPKQAQDQLVQVLADPQANAPALHQASFDFAREQTFTTPPGPAAQGLRSFFSNAGLGDFPAGRVVVPFFNVINNMAKYSTARIPGLALLNKHSKTFKDLTSKDDALRQLTMGKWATGGSILAFSAWGSMNGTITGSITDNNAMLSTIEKTQKKKRYSARIPGTDKMMSYNRLEPIGMIMGIGAVTAERMAYIKDPAEREVIALTAIAAIVPYMEDKSFMQGVSRLFGIFNSKGGDDTTAAALGRYFTDIAAGAPGALLGPLAPNTPLSKNITRNVFMDRAKRVAEENKWTIEKDEYGDDILIANSGSYRLWDRTIKKITAGTPGLSSTLKADVNIWGEDIRYEGGLGPDIITPIYINTVEVPLEKLKGHNFPAEIEAGRYRDMRVGTDLTIKQHKKFAEIVGINGELERLNMPLKMPRRDISARINGKNVGLPVKLNPDDRVDLIKIMNTIAVPNDAHPDRTRMNLKQTLDWMITQEEYAILPDDKDATGAKGDLIRKVYNEYKGAAIELFFSEHPNGELYFRKSVEMKQKAQNTGVQ